MLDHCSACCSPTTQLASDVGPSRPPLVFATSLVTGQALDAGVQAAASLPATLVAQVTAVPVSPPPPVRDQASVAPATNTAPDGPGDQVVTTLDVAEPHLQPELCVADNLMAVATSLEATQALQLPPLNSNMFCSTCSLRKVKPGNGPDENHCRCEATLPKPPQAHQPAPEFSLLGDLSDFSDDGNAAGSAQQPIQLDAVVPTALDDYQILDRWKETAPSLGGTAAQVNDQLKLHMVQLVSRVRKGSLNAPPAGGKCSKNSDQSLSNLAT